MTPARQERPSRCVVRSSRAIHMQVSGRTARSKVRKNVCLIGNACRAHGFWCYGGVDVRQSVAQAERETHMGRGYLTAGLLVAVAGVFIALAGSTPLGTILGGFGLILVASDLVRKRKLEA